MDEKPVSRPSYVTLAAWAAVAGAALWVLSPLITHTEEPWDSGYVYWFGLVVISASLAWYSRRRSALAPILIGLWLGQFLYGFVWLGFGTAMQRWLKTDSALRAFNVFMGLLLAATVVMFV